MIGNSKLGAGERGIVNDGRLLAAAGIDVAIDSVEAGVTDAVGKPAAVNASFRVEHRFRLFDPVDSGRRFAPKALRIALPARIDLVISARAGVHTLPPGIFSLFSDTLHC